MGRKTQYTLAGSKERYEDADEEEQKGGDQSWSGIGSSISLAGDSAMENLESSYECPKSLDQDASTLVKE